MNHHLLPKSGISSGGGGNINGFHGGRVWMDRERGMGDGRMRNDGSNERRGMLEMGKWGFHI